MQCLIVLDKVSHSGLSIKTIHPDGTNVKTIYQGEGWADAVAIDSDTKTLYWSNMGETTDNEDLSLQDGSINALQCVNGQWVNKVVSKGCFYTPKQICFDKGFVYFCDREGMGIYRVSPSGELNTLLITGDPDTQMFEYRRQNIGCMVNGEYLYFTQKGPPKGGEGRILRIKALPSYNPKGRTDIEVLLDHLPEPIDLMFGPKSGKLYWTDRGAAPDGNSLNRGVVQGNRIVNHEIITNGFDEAIGLTISPDESMTYVTDLSGCVYAVNNTTGRTETIYQGIKCTGIELAPESSFM